MQLTNEAIVELLCLKLENRTTSKQNAILENLAKESKEIQDLLALTTDEREFKQAWQQFMAAEKERRGILKLAKALFPEMKIKPLVEYPPELKDPSFVWLLLKDKI